ncbi:uncharacterized protein PHALS_12598 [Plasmopara halstedii]|uniref:Uncharacterized protein n=1 Tax=Plasmopara halstedii TaxID=4781 RepID=A0A0P1AME3_PLAHL|nr:uncharacterized protein PHALS_12598 [Plasmopara halstedii]CEG42314.1 hypothetical protein PHALS_12598 [Plasmopara halstedii]|eukprot:XP_024578683.1 hypothetical protein PHALS_12598 [Plasmopara halstedii]
MTITRELRNLGDTEAKELGTFNRVLQRQAKRHTILFADLDSVALVGIKSTMQEQNPFAMQFLPFGRPVQ